MHVDQRVKHDPDVRKAAAARFASNAFQTIRRLGD